MKHTLLAFLLLISTRIFAAGNCTDIHNDIANKRVPEVVSGYVWQAYYSLANIYQQVGVDLKQSQVTGFDVTAEMLSGQIIKCGNKQCAETIVRFTPTKNARVTNGTDIKDFTFKFQPDQDYHVTRFVTEVLPREKFDVFGDSTGFFCETRSYTVNELTNADIIYQRTGKAISYAFFNQANYNVETPITETTSF